MGFRSLSEGLDTITAAGRFTLTIMAALAEMEREPDARTHPGRPRRRQGRRPHRRPTPR
nr:recombinase family protein [Angustibacter aerolatus]